MRRPLIGLAAALAAIGLVAGGLAWLLNDPRPAPGASTGERLYYAYCVACHGEDGRGSWRSALFLMRPVDVTDPARVPRYSDRYLADLIKYGGAPLGRQGMPAFGMHARDAEIEALVAHVRVLVERSRRPARPGGERPVRAAARS